MLLKVEASWTEREETSWYEHLVISFPECLSKAHLRELLEDELDIDPAGFGGGPGEHCCGRAIITKLSNGRWYVEQHHCFDV